MKLVRYGQPGREKPGILDADGRIRDLSKVVPDIAGDALRPRGSPRSARPTSTSCRWCAAIRGSAPASAMSAISSPSASTTPTTRRKPAADPERADHLQQGADLHLRPERRRDDPEGIDQARLGSRARRRDRLARPLSRQEERDGRGRRLLPLQRRVRARLPDRALGGQWTKGKGCETFGPLGPWLVTKDEIKDPQNLDMWLTVNGKTRQKGSTRTMIFGVAHLVWYCSQFFVLEPGDVIITGTPPGVGAGHEADAAVPQGRRRGASRHRRPRRAEAEDREVQDVTAHPWRTPTPVVTRGLDPRVHAE